MHAYVVLLTKHMPGIELKKATPCKKRAPISIFQYNTNKSLTATAHHFHFASRLLSLVVKLSYGNRNRLLIPECEEILPPSLNSTSPRPPLFDGTTRLYLSYRSPCAQRAWVTRNYKGLQDKINWLLLTLKISVFGTKRFTQKRRCQHWNTTAKL